MSIKTECCLSLGWPLFTGLIVIYLVIKYLGNWYSSQLACTFYKRQKLTLSYILPCWAWPLCFISATSIEPGSLHMLRTRKDYLYTVKVAFCVAVDNFYINSAYIHVVVINENELHLMHLTFVKFKRNISFLKIWKI